MHYLLILGSRGMAQAASSGGEVPEGFSVTVIVFEDRTPPPAYVDIALRVNERYAAQFGFTFRLVTRCLHTESMPPFWARVALVCDAHRRASDDPSVRGFVVGLDSDAIFSSLSYDFRQELVEVPIDKAVVVVREALFRESGPTLSSGFFGVRLGPTGLGFLDDWLARYDPKRWRRDNGIWRTDDVWSGDAYEQGQLNRVVASHRAVVHELPQGLLNSGFARSVAGDAQERMLPGILHCTAWPGEPVEARDERARTAFKEILDVAPFSDVSMRTLSRLGEDELARTTKLLGRPPKDLAQSLRPLAGESALAPLEDDLAAAMRRAKGDNSEVVLTAMLPPSPTGARQNAPATGGTFEVLD